MKIDARAYCFSMNIKVRDYEVDSQGIVNNAVYLHYFEHTRHEFCEHAGFSFRQMSEQGIDPVVHKITVTYKASLGLGATAISCLNLKRKGVKFIFYQDIYRASDGQLCATGEIEIVSTVNGRATRGEEIAQAFAAYLHDDD